MPLFSCFSLKGEDEEYLIVIDTIIATDATVTSLESADSKTDGDPQKNASFCKCASARNFVQLAPRSTKYPRQEIKS